MEKQFVDLLTEELKLQDAVAQEHAHHMNITLAEAKRVASQYQREAEKCNAATETCEGAREQSEALLTKERKVTSLWERRARQLGYEGETEGVNLWTSSKKNDISGLGPSDIPSHHHRFDFPPPKKITNSPITHAPKEDSN
ncbi:unnamed protein product [Dovyalis caffra]|uniref:Uncharacterized protein n=1 Tax=Dovyalis caffra TaxID=77055 RepID=A0AAV1RRU6_9ROSI|nr:unnamed protein product [Dovyalis caffra]